LKNLKKLYKETDMKKHVEYVVTFFFQVGRPDILEKIYWHDESVLKLLRENIELQKRIQCIKKN